MSSQMIGKTVAGYHVTALLGKGGMGAVYRARDLDLDRDVALKIMDPHLAGDETFMKRFRTEARALAQLNDPQIVKVHTLRETEIGVCIIMEYVEGKTLGEVIKNAGPLDINRAVHIFRQVLSAFEHAHKAGVIHRDVKPGNIMIADADEVKITDFGLAKLEASGAVTMTQMMGGTLYYAPPEQLEGLSQVDHRGDLYSIGMTLYETLTGAVPFEKTESDFRIRKRIVEGKIPSPREFNPRIPKALSEFVEKAIARSPDRRYQSATLMRQALEKINLEPSGLPPRQDKKRLVPLFAAGALLLCVIAYLLFIVLSPKAAKLTVYSEPGTALIRIEGKEAGETPLKEFSLASGRVAVRAEKEGFAPVDTQITIAPGEEMTLQVILRHATRPTSSRVESAVPPAMAGGRPKEQTPESRNGASSTPPPEVKEQKGQKPSTVTLKGKSSKDIVATESQPPDVKRPELAKREAEQKEAERIATEGREAEARMRERLEREKRETENAEKSNKGLQTLVDQYRRHLESRDIASLAQMLQLSSDEQERWEKFFELAREVRVTIEEYDVQRTGNNAQVRFRARVAYFNVSKGEDVVSPFRNTWQCDYAGGRWSVSGHK